MEGEPSKGMAAFGLARARQIVGMHGYDSQDVDILASVMSADFGDGTLFSFAAARPLTVREGLAAFGIGRVESTASVNAWGAPGDSCAVIATFSLSSVRAACERGLFPDGTCFGIPAPDEVLDRLAAVHDSTMSRFLFRTACDRMAEHVLGLIHEMPGALRQDETVIWAWAGRATEMKSAAAWLEAPGPGSFVSRIDLVVPDLQP